MITGLAHWLANLRSTEPRTSEQQREIDLAKDVITHLDGLAAPTDADALLWMISCGSGAYAGDEWIVRELNRIIESHL